MASEDAHLERAAVLEMIALEDDARSSGRDGDHLAVGQCESEGSIDPPAPVVRIRPLAGVGRRIDTAVRHPSPGALAGTVEHGDGSAVPAEPLAADRASGVSCERQGHPVRRHRRDAAEVRRAGVVEGDDLSIIAPDKLDPILRVEDVLGAAAARPGAERLASRDGADARDDVVLEDDLLPLQKRCWL